MATGALAGVDQMNFLLQFHPKDSHTGGNPMVTNADS